MVNDAWYNNIFLLIFVWLYLVSNCFLVALTHKGNSLKDKKFWKIKNYFPENTIGTVYDTIHMTF